MGSQSQTRLSDSHFTLWGSHTLFLFFPVVVKSFHSGFPGGSDGKESSCSAGDLGSIPGLGRSPGEGNSNPLQYSCLENPMDRGVWWATVHGEARVRHKLATKLLVYIPPSPLPPSVTTVWFLCLWVYFCFVNKLICIIFSDSTYNCYRNLV